MNTVICWKQICDGLVSRRSRRFFSSNDLINWVKSYKQCFRHKQSVYCLTVIKTAWKFGWISYADFRNTFFEMLALYSVLQACLSFKMVFRWSKTCIRFVANNRQKKIAWKFGWISYADFRNTFFEMLALYSVLQACLSFKMVFRWSKTCIRFVANNRQKKCKERYLQIISGRVNEQVTGMSRSSWEFEYSQPEIRAGFMSG